MVIKRRVKVRYSALDAANVMKCHKSFSIANCCCSIWKTRQRLVEWFELRYTRSQIQRILEEAFGHFQCNRENEKVEVDSLNRFVHSNQCALFDQKKNSNEWTFVGKHFKHFKVTASNSYKALELGMARLLQDNVAFVLHDQSSSLTPMLFHACKSLCFENNITFYVHCLGLRLKLQAKVERTHTFQ